MCRNNNICIYIFIYICKYKCKYKYKYKYKYKIHIQIQIQIQKQIHIPMRKHIQKVPKDTDDDGDNQQPKTSKATTDDELGWLRGWVVRWFGVVWWRVGLRGWVAGRGSVVSVVVWEVFDFVKNEKMGKINTHKNKKRKKPKLKTTENNRKFQKLKAYFQKQQKNSKEKTLRKKTVVIRSLTCVKFHVRSACSQVLSVFHPLLICRDSHSAQKKHVCVIELSSASLLHHALNL